MNTDGNTVISAATARAADDERRRRIDYLLGVGASYWSCNRHLMSELDIPAVCGELGRRWTMVALPNWAADLGVGSPAGLLVDAGTIAPGPGPEWQRTDWWTAAFAHLQSVVERRHEKLHGPIHSYHFRLQGCDPRLFDRAWVNRIFLWLRRRRAVERQWNEAATFGPLPSAKFDLSHDVDAVTKTLNVRGKQTAFHLFNAVRLTRRRRFSEAATRLRRAVRFATSFDDYRRFDELCRRESEAGVRSTFHFYAGRPGPRSPKRYLFDPAYDVATPELRVLMRRLLDGGWRIGIHPGFDNWQTPEHLAEDCDRLRQACGADITECRQHWLRFSWQDTWRAQAAAGIRLDGTLGFNDRIGFRNGAALEFAPWDFAASRPMELRAVPLVLMDSHVYDYHLTAEQDVGPMIRRVFDEVRFVGGRAGVLWHPHTLAGDYGWGEGYRIVLDELRTNLNSYAAAA